MLELAEGIIRKNLLGGIGLNPQKILRLLYAFDIRLIGLKVIKVYNNFLLSGILGSTPVFGNFENSVSNFSIQLKTKESIHMHFKLLVS